jgi:hypothetical protein
MKEIQLTQGKVALVEDEDYAALSSVKWYARRYHRTFYALRKVPRPGGGRMLEYMHREALARTWPQH